MINHPMNAKESNQHVLDIGLYNIYRGYIVWIVSSALIKLSANLYGIALLIHCWRQGMNFTNTHLTCRSSVRMLWHVPVDILATLYNFLDSQTLFSDFCTNVCLIEWVLVQ